MRLRVQLAALLGQRENFGTADSRNNRKRRKRDDCVRMGCDDDAHWQAETKKMGKKKIPHLQMKGWMEKMKRILPTGTEFSDWAKWKGKKWGLKGREREEEGVALCGSNIGGRENLLFKYVFFSYLSFWPHHS